MKEGSDMGVVTWHQATADLVTTRQEEDHLLLDRPNAGNETLERGTTDRGTTVLR